MKDEVDTIKLENTTIHIFQDDDFIDPRDWDNLGTMVCFHRWYTIGDKNHDFESPNDVSEYLAENKAIVLRIRGYDHGGLSITADPLQSISYPFNDAWDSGWLGVIFVTYADIRKEYNWKYITSTRAKEIQKMLENEVSVYNSYLNGDVYGYIVTCNQCDEELDSCWGFYGSDWENNGLLDYAKGSTCKNCEEITIRLSNLIPDDGYMDGGEQYTESELATMRGD